MLCSGRTSSMVPLNPRYHGFIATGCSPSSMSRRLATMSRGLKLGMEVDQPVPMPSAPFTSTVGTTGMYLRQGARSRVGRRGQQGGLTRGSFSATGWPAGG